MANDKRFWSVRVNADKRFDDVLRAFKMESEHMREYIAKAAEGFGATLERIERRLEEDLRQSHIRRS